QCDSCDRILGLATSRAIVLVVPAFSMAEPHQAIDLKERARNRLSNDLQNQVRELGRSKQYHGVQDDFSALASVLTRSAAQERDGLQRVTAGLLNAAEVISLDRQILTAAADLQNTFRMSGQDAIVLASVLQHLQETTPAESCFLSRNSKDFDEPGVRDQLERLGCRYFADFDKAFQYIASRVGPQA
ncbi:MAG TPA: hypothetical protein VGV35_01340, partial [Bryobacteraceae bacterium]|nr:hypothetical protein [Bryobacteraceae bacterium]